MPSLHQIFDMVCNRSVDFIEQGIALAVIGALARRNLFHGLAVFCHRQLVEALVGTGAAARLFPEVAETRLELAVAANVVVRIVAIVRDSIDVLEAEGLSCLLRRMQDKVLRAVGMTTLCDFLDDVLGVLHVRALHRANPECPLTSLVRRNPEHHLVEVCIVETQDDGQEPFFTRAGRLRQRAAQLAAGIRAGPEGVVLIPIKT